jgi:hypothetical protein
MAKRNRKKTRDGFLFPAPFAAFLALLAGLGIVHLCMRASAESLGREIKALEVRRDQLRDRMLQAQLAWAKMQSPSNLDRALKEHGLVMTWPGRDQVIRVRTDGTVEHRAAPERLPGDRYARAVDRVVMND